MTNNPSEKPVIHAPAGELDWLKLPPVSPEPWRSVSFQYGAGQLAANHCGLAQAPDIPGHWNHGWVPEEHFQDPRLVAYYAKEEATNFWVGREEEATYLKEHGYRARAIGLPICYTSVSVHERREGSLLILPPHSVAGLHESWNEQRFIQHVQELKRRFDSIAVCVHAACFESGKWVTSLRNAGIPFVTGASHLDGNSLQRTRELFSQFEFVHLFAYGSAIAYATAFGAKVSLARQFEEIRPENYRWCAFYQDNPGLIKRLTRLTSHNTLTERWPWLFVDPEDAESNVEWGKKQIGMSSKLRPDDMKREFCWTTRDNFLRRFKGSARAIARMTVPKPIRASFHEIRHHRAVDPLDSNIDFDSSTEKSVVLHGQRFHYRDGQTLRGTYRSIFERAFYRIPVVSGDPTILDCGANIGLATRYWLSRYPRAKIVAFEPDRQIFALLEKNCAEVADANVTLKNAAVWTEDTTLTFQCTGAETGAIGGLAGIDGAASVSVAAVDLAAYLEEPIDFLKMDIEGAECDVLPALDGKLQNVMAMYVEYHSYAGRDQRLADILKVLETNGFRHAVNTDFSSSQPMRKIEESYGMDMRLDLWAWKPQ